MAVQYGVTRDYVLGLTVVLPTGEIIEAGTRTMKGVVGYDLTRLFLGSEGTLGVITRIILRLVPKPAARQTLAAGFGTLAAAAQAVGQILTAGLAPTALEFMDRVTLGCVRELLPFEVPEAAAALLLVAVDGHPRDVEERAAAIARFCREQGARPGPPGPDRGRGGEPLAGPQGHLPGPAQGEAQQGERRRGGAPGRYPCL